MTTLKITEAMLREIYEREERRRDLERQARALKAETELQLKSIEQQLVAAGRSSVARGSYRTCFVDGRATVSWKDEFIRVAGGELAQALIAAAVPIRRLTIILEKEAS